MSSTIGNIGSYDPTALYESLFKKIDSNSDGGIDKTEFTSALSDMASDQNVSKDEAAKMFAALDKDGNGKIDTKEMMKALKNAGEQARASMPPPPPPPGDDQTTLTDDQKKTVDSILSNYDSSNLTADDVTAINKAISDAGISFGKSLGDEIESNGFSIQTMMSLSPPPSQGANESSASTDASANDVTSEQNSLFSDLIKSLSSSQTSESDESDLFSSLIESLKSSTTSSDDQITSIFNSLIQEMQNSARYSQTGNVSYTTGNLSSLLSEYA